TARPHRDPGARDARHLPIGGDPVIAALALAALLSTEPDAGKRLALVAGNDRFDDAHWPALRYAAKDARDVEKALAGFDRIFRAGEHGRATKKELLGALDALALANTSDLDTVVI